MGRRERKCGDNGKLHSEIDDQMLRRLLHAGKQEVCTKFQSEDLLELEIYEKMKHLRFTRW